MLFHNAPNPEQAIIDADDALTCPQCQTYDPVPHVERFGRHFCIPCSRLWLECEITDDAEFTLEGHEFNAEIDF